MPSLLTAGSSTDPGITYTGSNDGALTIQTGSAGAKVNAIALAADGTATLAKPLAGGSLTLATAQNTTSGTSIDFTSIPSWVKRITLMFNGISTNGTSPVQVQVGAGSVTTSGYACQAAYISGASPANGGYTSGFVVLFSQTAAGTYSGALTLTNMGSNTWCETAQLCFASGGNANYFSSGVISLGGALDRLRLTTVNGTDTFDAGSVNILYEG